MKLSRVVLLLMAATAQAGAEDARDQAAALYDQGKAHYQANEFQAAAAKFTRAYELARDPVYLFNIAQSYRNAADCKAAYDHYTRFLAEDPAAANADAVRGWIRELEPCARRIQDLEDRAAKAATSAASPPGPAAGTVERRVDRGRSLRMGGLALAGVGAAGLVAGIVYGVQSQGYENEVAIACARGCTWDDVAGQDDAGRAANTRSMIGYIAGGVALGAGIGLYVLGTTKVERVMITPTDGGAHITARLRF